MTSSLGRSWIFWLWHIDDHIEQLFWRGKCLLCHVWLFSFDPNHWISFNWSFFLCDPVGLGMDWVYPTPGPGNLQGGASVCVKAAPLPWWAAGGQQENIDSQRPSYSRQLHRALSCRVGTKTRKYRQSDTGVDGPGTYNHSGLFLCSFRGEQNTFIYLYMFTKSVSFMPYEVCSMYEYKKRKGLERDWELRPLIKYCLKIT